jgi:FixJ family two-component response regulator
MMHMRGTELATLLRRYYPGIKIVYMSGYQDYGADERNFEKGCLFVQKPFSRDNLLDVIAHALKADRAKGVVGDAAKDPVVPVEDRLQVQEHSVSAIQAMVSVPMKARRRASRRGRRPVAV